VAFAKDFENELFYFKLYTMRYDLINKEVFLKAALQQMNAKPIPQLQAYSCMLELIK